MSYVNNDVSGWYKAGKIVIWIPWLLISHVIVLERLSQRNIAFLLLLPPSRVGKYTNAISPSVLNNISKLSNSASPSTGSCALLSSWYFCRNRSASAFAIFFASSSALCFASAADKSLLLLFPLLVKTALRVLSSSILSWTERTGVETLLANGVLLYTNEYVSK